jgi:hypothetical protein
MESENGNKPLWLMILRCCARIIAILIVAFILIIFIGEGGTWSQPKNLPLGSRDYIILSIWGLYIVGLIIGLWREGLGGLISLFFMAIHIVILSAEGDRHLTNFYVLLLPGILYVLSWFFHRGMVRQQ